ncbi:hypothetical protein MTO96_035198 [Rhipicephalus appendiculatus]
MLQSLGVTTDESQKKICTSPPTEKAPGGSFKEQGKQRPSSELSRKDGPTQGATSLSSTIKLDIDFRKRAALVSVNLVIMLISVVVLWYALYSYVFRPSQPYKFWTSLVTKSFVFTFLLHLDVFLIIVSGFSAIASGVGFVGALRENIPLLQAYEAFIGIFAIVLVMAAGLAVAFPQVARRSVMRKPSYIDFVRAYRNNPDFQHLIDSVQESLSCCGFSADSFRDWNYNEYYRCDADNPSVQRCSVPPSCCRPTNSSKKTAVVDNLMCARGVLLMDDASAWAVVYVRSCADATQAYLASKYHVFAAVAVLVTIVCLALFVVTHDVQEEITDLRSIYDTYYETVHHGQMAMHKAGVIKVVNPDDVTTEATTGILGPGNLRKEQLTTGGSRSVGSTGQVAI